MLPVLQKSSFLLVLLLLALAYQSGTVYSEELVGLPQGLNARPDFSGSWEKDYRRSDDWEQKLNLKTLEIRRQIERQSQRRSFSGERAFSSSINSGRSNGTNIIDLARFAELISRSNDLYISQTDADVRIKRDGEADLICGTGEQALLSDSGEPGSKGCGWNGRQLIFKVNLPGNIGIYYQFTVSSARDSIKLQTRVSNGDLLSFDLMQFFNRYSSSYQQYSCQQTLTKGKVCSQTKQDRSGKDQVR